MRTFTPKPADINRAWHVIDAEGQVLGKVATEVANLLRGKHKPIWAPHVDTGDHVIVVNAAKLDISARKLADKQYHRHSGYPGGLTTESLEHLLGRDPERVVRLAVRGMLPKNRLGRAHDPQAAGLRRSHPSAHRPAAAAPRAGVEAFGRSTVPKPLIQSTGRRKEAVARVRLRPGSGVITVNGRPFEQYFPILTAPGGRARAAAPHADRRRVRRRRHARRRWRERPGRRAARSASPARSSPSTRKPARGLKKAGLLTRDAREKERRKYGLKKARKAPQYSKR